jgi:predicted ABC-type ATPase
MYREQGADYFNPDEAAKKIRDSSPGVTPEQANAEAWAIGKRLLERAILERRNFAFETTLGGRTIASLLENALDAGFEVRMQFVGLASPELHIQRVRSRVVHGGHDIPEEKIRERFHQSRLNLIRLLPKLTELLLYDNSRDADPRSGAHPEPVLLLHLKRAKVVLACDPSRTPAWAKPILLIAAKLP